MLAFPQPGRSPGRWPIDSRRLLRRIFFLLAVVAAVFASLPSGLQAQTLINAGGPAAFNFQPDVGFSGGSVAANATTAIDTSGAENPGPAASYVDERYGDFSYTIGGLAPSTRYRVRLHFVESYWTTAGQRLFNVAINGNAALSNFDIFAAAGNRNRLVIREVVAPADASGNMTIQFTSVVNNAKVDALEVLPVPLLAINAGGPAIGGFVADGGFTGGSVANNPKVRVDTSAVTNAAPAAAYNNERYGNFRYAISNLTPFTRYRIRLHFVESYWTRAGQRLFNVTMNGTQVLSNFDIFVAAGVTNRPVIKDFDASANASGVITIQFSTVVNNAKVDALEIYTAPPPPRPPRRALPARRISRGAPGMLRQA